jgi:RNA 2',3'-cyclic 3'-phosphodiesterase
VAHSRDAHREPGAPAADRLRAFFALALDPAPRRAAAACVDALRRAPGGAAVRWLREENLHVTLRFLGNIDAAWVPELLACVRDETARLAPFALELGGAQWFPSERRPRVIALALTPLAPLEALAAAAERGVVAAGAAPEPRPFHAHLTLGRVSGPAARQLDVTAPDTPPAEAWGVTQAVLYRSELHSAGAKYTPLGCAPLGAPGGSVHP